MCSNSPFSKNWIKCSCMHPRLYSSVTICSCIHNMYTLRVTAKCTEQISLFDIRLPLCNSTSVWNISLWELDVTLEMSLVERLSICCKFKSIETGPRFVEFFPSQSSIFHRFKLLRCLSDELLCLSMEVIFLCFFKYNISSLECWIS